MPTTPPFDRLARAQRTAVISIVSGDEPRRDFFTACRSHLNSSSPHAFRSAADTARYSWLDSNRLKAALFLLDRVGSSGNERRPAATKRYNSSRINNLASKPLR